MIAAGTSPIFLEKPSSRRREDFLAAARKSRRLHGQWTSAPQTPSEFDAYLKRDPAKTHLGYWVVTETRELAGVINISEIVRGSFCSGYLGYYAFAPHDGQGYMTQGLAAVLSDAFDDQGLHRLEANIQPGNKASRSLVERLGFPPRRIFTALFENSRPLAGSRTLGDYCRRSGKRMS